MATMFRLATTNPFCCCLPKMLPNGVRLGFSRIGEQQVNNQHHVTTKCCQWLLLVLLVACRLHNPLLNSFIGLLCLAVCHILSKQTSAAVLQTSAAALQST
jgi:hypothetical protein